MKNSDTNNNEINFVVVDIETSGLSPLTDEILEIGCVLPDGDGFAIKVKPEHIETASPVALRINGYNEKEWEDALPLKEALQLLNSKVPLGAYLMAYNVAFDWGFLDAAYQKTGIQVPFHYHKLDLLTLAWSKLPPGSPLSLKKVCEQLGIEAEPTVHRALAGAVCAHAVFKKLS